MGVYCWGQGKVVTGAALKLDWHKSNHENYSILSTYLFNSSKGINYGRGGAAAHSGSKFADLDSLLMGAGEGMDGSNVKSISIN